MTNIFHRFAPPIRDNENLRTTANIKTYDAKTTILHENDPGGSVYFILEGKVNITGYSASGREIWYSKLEAGDIFGEMAALQGGLRTASVIAATATTTAIISNAEFLALLQNNADMSLWLLRELVQRLDETTKQLYERVALNMTTRMCVQLLERCSTFTNFEGEYEVKPRLVLAQLARQLNTDRENVSRAISELVKEGVLRRDGRDIFILDKHALEAKAQE